MLGFPADNISVNAEGKLCFAGRDVTMLAQKYGTPLWILDEDRLRRNCRMYVRALKEYSGLGSVPLYASKALCMKGIYPMIKDEGMYADVVSGYEMETALSAGFPADRMLFHGNNKTAPELRCALEAGIGFVASDNPYELHLLDKLAGEAGKKQRILLRLTPGIDPHTFSAVNTGRIDCQFGMPIETGQAREFALEALTCENLELVGYDCHVGSQIFDVKPFMDAAAIMTRFAASIKEETGFEPEILNLGGGFGVRYKAEDPVIDIPDNIGELSGEMARLCRESGLSVPRIMLEPGRSIIADACMTLYTAGPVKEIKGYRKYVIVDGGMSDNPRYALYGSPYTVYDADRMNEECTEKITVAGRCCESGALIQEYVPMPLPEPGDIIAVCTTGAYNYSMSMNYNRLPRPAMVLLAKDGSDRLIVRRQTVEDMAACEMI